jgi:hypothetical protein
MLSLVQVPTAVRFRDSELAFALQSALDLVKLERLEVELAAWATPAAGQLRRLRRVDRLRAVVCSVPE